LASWKLQAELGLRRAIRRTDLDLAVQAEQRNSVYQIYSSLEGIRRDDCWTTGGADHASAVKKRYVSTLAQATEAACLSAEKVLGYSEA